MAEVKVTARLEQLSCPSCADMIVNVVSKLKGVEAAEVRYTTSKLLVTYDESQVDWSDIEGTVSKLGYAVKSKTQRGE